MIYAEIKNIFKTQIVSVSIKRERNMAFKYRMILVVVGLLVVLMGLYPLLSSFAFMQGIKGLPAAGTTMYQVIIMLLGVISIGYGLQGQAKPKTVRAQ